MTAAEHENVMTFAFVTASMLIILVLIIVNFIDARKENRKAAAEKKRIDEIIKQHNLKKS